MNNKPCYNFVANKNMAKKLGNIKLFYLDECKSEDFSDSESS